MDLIKEVKQRADIVKVAEYYGLKLDRAYKCVCPFHKEKTASFSISQSKQIFKCFGCGAGGDCITLVSKLLNINAYQSAISINDHLGLGLNPNQKTTHFEINQYKVKRETEEKFKQWENKTFQLLCDYLHLMWHWEKEKAPKSPDDEVDELYVEALHNIDYIDYLLDEIFINGTDEDKIWFWKTRKKLIDKIRRRINERNMERY